MQLSLIALDKPTAAFALMFTSHTFCGAPITVGRKRISEPTLGAVLINNKISNVCAKDGVMASETLCLQLAPLLQLSSEQVLPSSTGIIGWQLPTQQMVAQLPRLTEQLQSTSVLPAALGIMTTDLYPKIRRIPLGQGSMVGIAKGAGMVEPHLATMLVYLLTDIDMPRVFLREALQTAVSTSFNAISIDSDQSTSDTVALLSSCAAPSVGETEFVQALQQVCADLARDVVRNGEGVHHVMQVTVKGARSTSVAKGIGKSVINSPLWQTAVCGNDPNIGRLVMAIGKYGEALDPKRCQIWVGGQLVFSQGSFDLSPGVEKKLVDHLKQAEIYSSTVPTNGIYVPPIDFPPHERHVEIVIDLGAGSEVFTVWGSDRSHEYISENADYRS
jgi:glutamate N-acetyltransferase/amino-acid N-acetyltransferase